MNHELIAEYLKQIDLAENEHSPWRRRDYADGLVDILRDIFTDDELIELAQAKAEGRIVVLPCKVGDTVYEPFVGKVYEKTVDRIIINRFTTPQIWIETKLPFGASRLERWDMAFGKTVFLTREEAEKALGGAEDGSSKNE
jgi:hypothetical protein